MEGSSGVWSRIRQKPFALWVIFGGFLYIGLVILGVALPMLAASPASITDPFVVIFLVFMALFFVSAYLSLKGKRWTSVLTAVVSILFLVVLGSFLGPSLANPADGAFSLAISWIPALVLVAIFSILSIVHAKGGLLQKRYLATPNSLGGLLTIGVIGFVVGGLVVGAIGAGVILRNIAAGTADVTIVRDAASVAVPYLPATFPVAVGITVTWINKDVTAHTVTSSLNGTIPFDSGPFTTGATWSHTFTQPGTYWYYCTIHPMMVGRVIVS